MKTNILKLMAFFMCLGGFMTIEAQGLYNLATLDKEDGSPPNPWTLELEVKDTFGEGIEWADNTIGGSFGAGWSDVDGNSETSFCLGAEYLHRITGARQNPNGAGYLGAFGTYHNLSSENFDENLFRVGAKFSYFDPITAFNEAQLIYGVKAFYDTGSQEFSGSKEDVSGYGVSAYTGVNLRVSNCLSIGVEVPVLSYLSRTFDANGSEFKADSFSAAINKDNPVTATARFNLGRSLKWSGNKDTDGDGIWDKDDACPNIPGLDLFNGCPDTDGDGVQDGDDSCPNEIGPASNNGCPIDNGNGIDD